MMKRIRPYFFLLLVVFVLSEVGVRVIGLGNFPLYETDSLIGYIPAPRQSGKFLIRNDWVFNDRSMGVKESFQGSDKTDLLVIGDSLVLGGNPYRQEEKLGPQLQNHLGNGYKIWPIGAPSWGFLNEKEYIDRHPEVLSQVDEIVWIFNSGDFQNRSQWWTDSTHPRAKPLCLSYYVLNKYLLEGKLKHSYPTLLFWVKPPAVPSVNPIDEQLDNVSKQLQAMNGGHFKRKVVVFYPNKFEEGSSEKDIYQSLSDQLEERANKEGWRFLDLRKCFEWKTKYYRDEIHPTAEGYEIMAKEVAEALEK